MRVCLLICLIFGGVVSAAERRPNIVLIMADDVGIEAFGCYGGTSYKTPSIDKLAAGGVRYTHAYAQPLCTPTRVQLMTGKYNQRNWKVFGILDPEERTFGHMLGSAGYKTCISGKWQLQSYDPPDYPGAEKRRGTGMHPKEAGFDSYQLYHALHTEDKGSRYADPTFLRDGELHKELKGKYGESLNVDHVLKFMEDHLEEPMFVYYPMALPHWPMVPTPDSVDWADPEKRHEADTRHFPDMVEYMDKLVGRLVDGIEELGLREETLILFYSDNGTHLDITSKMGDVEIPGGKALPTQAGIRVPLIANWPAKVKPGTRDHLVDASDFLPTLAEVAGAEIPEGWHVDGKSFAKSIFSEEAKAAREWCFFWYDPRPGWDKDRFTRHIFAVDHRYKLFSDGRMFSIDPLLPVETELDASALNEGEEAARAKLEKVISDMMKEPLCEAAKMDPEVFGKP